MDLKKFSTLLNSKNKMRDITFQNCLNYFSKQRIIKVTEISYTS